LSAITPDTNILPNIRGYRTRIKVVIHSHVVAEPLVLKQEITGFSSNKIIKSAGNCTIQLVPDQDYLNRIFPNDYINVYIDRGDGEGFTRIFFGFIDRINETSTIAENGTPNTVYTLSCTDFQKAFEKTMIYFNPNVGKGREDFDASWVGSLNIGGLALATKGVAVTGSPADVLTIAMFTMLGASCQFILPEGYTPKTKDKFREQRAQFAINRLSSEILQSVPNGTSIVDFLSKAEEVSTGSGITAGDSARSLVKTSNDPTELQAVQEAITEVAKQLKSTGIGSLAVQTKAILASTKQQIASFLDILDVFTFVEREAIDGYMQSVSFWQNEGALMNMFMSMCNEPVNELFFDLRPAIDSSVGLSGGSIWSLEPDEIGGNIDDTTSPGIRYVPSMVFREYPFSTIDGLDLTSVKLGIAGKDGVPLPIGNMQFGSIFSDGPNVKGRHVIEVDNINVEDLAQGKSQNKAKKHIDVAVISPTEIVSSDLGRSDHEHFNLMQFISDSVLGSDGKFYMHDILPIISPIHIMRHGLRVRELTTSFARFSENVIPNLGSGSSIEEQGSNPDEVQFSGNTVSPIALGSFNESSSYGIWRARPTPVTPTDWIFHHGVDLRAPIGTAVRAVSDGYVVAAAPAGTPRFSGYGNCVVIKHKDPYLDQSIFSVYAHLDAISDDLFSQNPNRVAKVPNCCSRELLSQGRMSSIPISAGTVIGTVGDTKGADASGTVLHFTAGTAHLHFEIIKQYPAKKTEIGVPPRQSYVPTPPELPDYSTLNSLDPVQFLLSKGVDISSVPNTYQPGDDDKDDENTDLSKPDESQFDTNTNTGSQTLKNIDNGKIRSAITRWALLNDHWYQHNLEYLSGTIRMRGAPEIRVGYRLDIDDVKRPLSFYVEGVAHNWTFPGTMETTLTVTRGQNNSPFPVYVLPYIRGVSATSVQRKTDSRLGKFFLVPRPKSASNGVFISDKIVAGNPYNSDSNDLVDTKNIDTVLTDRGNTSSNELFISANDKLDLQEFSNSNNKLTDSAKSIVEKAQKELSELEKLNLSEKVSTNNTALVKS
jgi:murein DD-endopeptidase MepM/ murein hydrolase activator NlpD